MVAALRGRRLELGPGVTFLVGENGSGKSTLVEAIAVAAGVNAEGGSRNFAFATRSSESSLRGSLRIGRAPGGAPLLPAYGGVSPHERSHGQSFLDLLTHRFRPCGLYLLDEPEAALSTNGQLAALARIQDLTTQDSQFLIATHSPILLALPGARILEIGDDGGLRTVRYDDALPVRTTRDFLADPGRTPRHLLG